MPDLGLALTGAAALAASLGWLGAAAWFVARFRAPALPEDGRVTLLLCTTGNSPPLRPAQRGDARPRVRHAGAGAGGAGGQPDGRGWLAALAAPGLACAALQDLVTRRLDVAEPPAARAVFPAGPRPHR
jgi:hypothetical protein